MSYFLYEYPLLWEWLKLRHPLAACDHGDCLDRLLVSISSRVDLGLVQRPGAAGRRPWRGVAGAWRRLTIHIQKYLVAPPNLPEHLTWFKWESYATWLSGVALLWVVLLCRGRNST